MIDFLTDEGWWGYGHFRSSNCFHRYRTVHVGKWPCEVRVYAGPQICVAVLRNKRYKRVHYTECGHTASVRRLTPYQLEDAIMGFLRRAAAAGAGESGSYHFPDEKWQKRYPALYEQMTAVLWPEGGARQVSTLSIFADEGQLKGSLNNRDEGMVLFATGKTLDGLLMALEGLLTAEETPWRRSAWAQQREGKKGGRKA